MYRFRRGACVFWVILVTACGGDASRQEPTFVATPDDTNSSSSSGSSSSTGDSVRDSDTRTGFLLDGIVANIAFRTPSQAGFTSASGEFQYEAGEIVMFSIGDLHFPEVFAKPTLTPQDFGNTKELKDPVVTNVTRLLQSLDVDGDPANGIVIAEHAFAHATPVDFQLSVEAFAASEAITNLVANSGSVNRSLIDVDQALDHLKDTLANHVNRRVVLSADGPGNTYELINNTFGGTAVETPVCDYSTDSFGRRITEVHDEILNEYVFAFHIVKDLDGDRCRQEISDRQRIEIKTYGASPARLVATEGEIHTYRWKFKLNRDFQPSPSFTHVFQLKASGGDDDGMPIITMTPRYANPERLDILYSAGGASETRTVATVNLAELKGQWIEAFVRVLNSDNGSLEVVLRRLADQETLLSWSHNQIDLWRTGAAINRPKWGIYRSLNNAEYLRDETVLFNDFCIAEAANTCPQALDAQAPQ